MTTLDLTAVKALSFDCYGTLIDWEAGISAGLAPGRPSRAST
jgi:2-haloacid dehalogenase